MSNFSNIGFKVESEEEYYQLLDGVGPKSTSVETSAGIYFVYTDFSGAELWIQVNKQNECIGVNPHFRGKSKRNVCLTKALKNPENEMDGAFYAWAEPSIPNDPDSGMYPFVFDLPDFRTINDIEFPKNFDVQLAAFAQELSVFDDESLYKNSQSTKLKMATLSFIPSGLFSFSDENEPVIPQAIGIFTGKIKEW